MNITQFTMEEVRCFAERQVFNIRPLTFLVGENSTGKTTVLGCFQVLANYLNDYGIGFNSAPYSMGVFRDIVRNSRKAEKVLKLGFTFRGTNEDIECSVEFVEKEGGVEPATRSAMLKFTDGEITLSTADNLESYIHLTSYDKERNQYHVDVNSDVWEGTSPFFLFERVIHMWLGQSEDEIALANYLDKKKKHTGIPWAKIEEYLAVFSISPIRSQPKRTYDPTEVFNDPEGGDVPEWLRWTKVIDQKQWTTLKARLVEFGKRSDLFQNIEVKNLGGSMGDPFQLKMKVRGPNSNIIDVGYGVSQILPILVYILEAPIFPGPLMGPPCFLLQQPEVHLHPRAQAELSSLLATLASKGNRAFIVETHSDYMIDRARIEIKKGNIRPEDVSLIYLEPKGRVVRVHNISFDKMANMEGVPPHYGEFFLKEYRQLMGFED